MTDYTVRKVRMSGDYETSTGRYYGAGMPIYVAHERETGDEIAKCRAATRAEALEKLPKLVTQKRACGAYYLDGHGWCH